MVKERSLPAKFVLGVWHFINGSRKVFLNLLFLLFMYAIYATLMQPAEQLRLKPDTTLVIRPYGNVVEQFTGTAMDRALEEATGQDRSETRLRDMLEAIHRAAGDDSITQLVIDPSYMWSIGLAALNDLDHAVDAFRSTGKQIIAVGDSFNQQQYYLAALADEISTLRACSVAITWLACRKFALGEKSPGPSVECRTTWWPRPSSASAVSRLSSARL
jgi:protease-4